MHAFSYLSARSEIEMVKRIAVTLDDEQCARARAEGFFAYS